MKRFLPFCLLLTACGVSKPALVRPEPKPWNVSYPLPARLVCTMTGEVEACVWLGPDQCHVDHPTYKSDVATGICEAV